MKVESEPKTRIMSLQEAMQFLHQAAKDSIYVEVKEIEPGKFIVPFSLLDIHASMYGKIHRQQGQAVRPSGGVQLATIGPIAGAGGAGSAPIPLGAVIGLDLRNMDAEALIHYISLIHDDTGNNRTLYMHFNNATMTCDILQRGAVTIAPDVYVPIYPHVYDSAGAYHPNYPGGWAPLVVDGINHLTLEMIDLGDTQLVTIKVVYSTMAFE